MKILSKSLAILLSLFFVLSAFIPQTHAATVNIKKSRVSYTLKDSNGVKYSIYMIPTSEQKAKGSFNDKYGWDSVWAGVSEGDTLYHGNYKLYMSKLGSKSVIYTGIQINDYTYNESRKMIYSLPSKYKGQPDLFIIAETESSNFESGSIYYALNGKLKKAKDSFGYTLRPQNIGKNLFRTAGYNNADGKWYIGDYKFNVATGQLSETQMLSKRVNLDSFVKSWRKDWR